MVARCRGAVLFIVPNACSVMASYEERSFTRYRKYWCPADPDGRRTAPPECSLLPGIFCNWHVGGGKEVATEPANGNDWLVNGRNCDMFLSGFAANTWTFDRASAQQRQCPSMDLHYKLPSGIF